ncbi:ATP-grasp domain-containing protein [Dictyoglomus turgidum]|jgi:predicted ATP-grasp superfamily ATP-dependent carboligase|nr:ATP-grasp domain-containing protein [Dictyoglomus turgidum]
MFRVLVTSGSYKHSIAIQKYLKISIPDIYLIVQDDSKLNFSRLYGYANVIKRCSLEEALLANDFDMVIPVGAKDILPTLKYVREKAILPSEESIRVCFNKYQTIQLAKTCGVPVPFSIHLKSLKEIEKVKGIVKFPCVIKPSSELEAKFVFYANNQKELNYYLNQSFKILGENSQHGVILQEYISGMGVGFFALYKKGNPVRIFMHQRLREWPISGGASTAAKAFYSDKLKNYGLTLLNTLNWNGVAMVEFKYKYDEEEFYLMEVNPKFWGSLELALRAGVNFPADLVRIFRGESLSYSENYNINQHFYWPLDGDILNLVKTKRLYLIREYFNPNVSTC